MKITARKLKMLGKGIVLSVALGSTFAYANDLSDVKDSGVFKIATEDDYAPFNFMTNGTPDGFHKDILNELKSYSKDFKVEQSILPWTGLLASVASGQYDAAITGALVTDERLRVFNFVTPVASAQHFYVKRKGDDRMESIADLDGKVLGIQAGSALLARLPELKDMLAETGGELGKVVAVSSLILKHTLT